MSSQSVITTTAPAGWFTKQRARLAFVGVLAATATIAAPMSAASAAVPSFPDNLGRLPRP